VVRCVSQCHIGLMACSQVWGAPGAGDCSGTCAGAEVVCFEPEGTATTSQWRYTGANQSGYAPTISYQHIGEGGGNWRQELVTTSWGWKLRKCCLWLLACALLLPAVYFSIMLVRKSSLEANSAPEAEIGTESLVRASSMPFDCSDGDLWSLPKQNWCCERFGRGCPTTAAPRRPRLRPPPPPPHPPPRPPPPTPPPPPPTSLPFDCNVDFIDCDRCLLTRWSAGKRAWCCAHARRGCAPPAQPPSPARVERVPVPVPVPAPAPKPCPHHKCQCPPLDCKGGLNNWKNAWGPEKKAWCCHHEGKGCE